MPVSTPHGHPLNIPPNNTGRFDSTATSGYQLPITPTSKLHYTTTDSTESVASSLSSCGSSIPPPSPGDVLYPDSRNPSRDRVKHSSSPPITPPCTATFVHNLAAIKSPSADGKNRTQGIPQNVTNSVKRDSLIMPPPIDYQKDIQSKGLMYTKGSESMQNIPGKEVNIHHSPSVGGDLCSGTNTSFNEKAKNPVGANNGSWVEGATVMTQSQSRSSSSYMSTFTSVTTSSRTSITSECVDGRKISQHEMISNPILCQSPIPYSNNRTHEPFTILSTQHASQDEYNQHSAISKMEPSPAPSPKSPLNLQELDTGDSGVTDPSGGSSVGMASTLQVPKSPRTPSMGHVIQHRFQHRIKPGNCDFCSKTMFRGLKCKECKFKCHIDCEQNVPPSCGLPEEMVKYYFNHLSKENSPILTRPMPESERPIGYQKGGQGAYFGGGMRPPHPNKPYDSSSNTSSCNSSTPSSPAVILDHISTNPTPPHSATMYTRQGSLQFTFPNPRQPVADPSHHVQSSHLGQYVSSVFQQDPALLSVTSGTTVDYQQTPQSNQLETHQQAQQISSPQAPPQNPRSPNPLIVSIQSNDSDKTLSSKFG